jgi:hypothetical protein
LKRYKVNSTLEKELGLVKWLKCLASVRPSSNPVLSKKKKNWMALDWKLNKVTRLPKQVWYGGSYL